MAHNIEFNKQKNSYSFFSANKPVWHGLGKVVDGTQTSEEAIRLANLDFNVSKYQNHVDIKGCIKPCPNSYSLVRDDTTTIFADKVTSSYQIVQNIEAFKFIDDIIGSKQAVFETAGSLFDGRVIFLTAKMPEPIVLKSAKFEDVLECYLVITNSHDGTSPIRVVLTPVRVVCWNTLQTALSNTKDSISFKHTTNIQSRLDNAAKIIKLNTDLNKMATYMYQRMVDTKISNYEFEAQKYIAELFLTNEEYITENNKILFTDNISTRKANMVNDMLTFTLEGVGQNTITTRGTAFGLYNGITGYYTHKKYNGESQRQIDENRVNSILFGSNKDIMIEALNLAYCMVND